MEIDPLAPNALAEQTQTPPPAPRKRAHNYAFLGLGILILLAIFLPNSEFAQMLGIPIVILGAVAGIKFLADSVSYGMKLKNALVTAFVIVGGLGVGIVIFLASLVAGFIVGYAKDPHPQSTG